MINERWSKWEISWSPSWLTFSITETPEGEARFLILGGKQTELIAHRAPPGLTCYAAVIFQKNGMLTGWFHGPAHLLWFIRHPHWEAPVILQTGQNIVLDRKKDKRMSVKDTSPLLTLHCTWAERWDCFILRFLATSPEEMLHFAP